MGAPFVWFDLTAADGAKVAGFYQGLFRLGDRTRRGGLPGLAARRRAAMGGNRPGRGGAGWALDSLRCGGQPRCRCEQGG